MRSAPYIEAFIEECLAAGLSKEATASLLIVDSIKEQGTHFEEGFKEAMRKDAKGMQGLRQLMQKAAPAMKTTGMLGGGGATALVINNLVNDSKTPAYSHIVPPGKYDKGKSEDRYYDALDSRSQGIADINSRMTMDPAREAELELAVEGGGVDSTMARQELQKIYATRGQATQERDRYLAELNESGMSANAEAEKYRSKLRGLEGAETSMWKLPQRIYANMRYGAQGSARYFESKRNALTSALESSTVTERMLADQARRLHGGYTGGSSRKAPTPAEMQRNFFAPR